MKIDFNQGWRFYKKGSDRQETVNLPHDAMLYEERDPHCKNSQNSGYFPGGWYIYEKEFDVPEEYLSQYAAVLFEGVYRNATVFLNDEKLLFHAYGYTAFEAELKGLKAGKNVIRVEADNRAEPNSRWYSGSGIYRPVYLIVKDHDYISDVKIETISCSPPVVKVTCSHTDAAVTIYDGTNVVYRGGCGKITMEKAKLWDAEHPNLYRCVIVTKKDTAEQNFGIRKIECNTKEGLLINGKPTKLRGGCIHHDNGILGACAFRDAEYRKISILKEAGYNAIRSAHNPCSEFLLEACDQLGMYVMDEAFDQWYMPKTKHDYGRDFDENYLDDIKRMVEKDRNHPSVIIYSIGNEISETAQERGINLSRELVAYVHSLDYTRPVTCGINLFLNGLISKGFGIYNEDGEGMADKAAAGENEKMDKLTGSAFFNYLMEHLSSIKNVVSLAGFADRATQKAFAYYDICGYNYGSARYKKDGRKYPERIIVGSETYIPEIFKNWKKVQRYPYIIGDFIWTAWDYLGEAGLGTWRYGNVGYGKPYPMLTAGSGAIELTGTVSPQAYYTRVAYGLAREPKMAVRPVNYSGEKCIKSPWRMTDTIESWSFPGCEGKEAAIEVYSDAPQIELWLNNQSVAKKKPKNGICRFTVPYQPGKLLAKAYDKKGSVTGSCALHSAEGQPYLKAVSDKTELTADGQSLAFIDITITDKKGVRFVLQETRIHVKVEGGTLQGIGTDRSATEESYVGNECTAYWGKALAVVRAGYEPGNIKVTVSAEGFEDKTIVLNMKKKK